MKVVLSVKKEFTRTPGPRYIEQGEWSGEEFRKIIMNWLKSHDIIEVDLDGTAGYGSSFIDEAFGGLIRERLINPLDVRRRVLIKSDEDPSYKIEAEEAISEAISSFSASR